MTPLFKSRWLGRQPYEAALEWQEARHTEVRTNADGLSGVFGGVIGGLEHNDVVTLGKRGDPEKDFSVDERRLRELGFDVFKSERGGQATLHSPGQLVIYPILPLRQLALGAREYVECLEQTTALWLEELGIKAWRATDEPGLYTESGKIVFFGVRIRQGVTLHGLAVNVVNDLSRFSWIRSCGRTGERFDRLAAHGIEMPLEELFSHWIQVFSREILRKTRVPKEACLTQVSAPV